MSQPIDPNPVDGVTRHHVTVLFADLSGWSRLSELVAPERMERAMAEFGARCREIIPRHRGQLVQIQGDGIFAVFGLPHPGERDSWHAVSAALEIRAAAPTIQVPIGGGRHEPLQAHCGIHSGLVLARGGDELQGRLVMSGPAPNAAKRLAEAAGGGQIFVSGTTLGTHVSLFEHAAVPPPPRGGEELAHGVWSILGASALETGFAARQRAGLTPYVGRDRERAELAALATEVRDGDARVVAVIGPAGLGKSRLVTEFLATPAMAGWQVHEGWCESYAGAEPLRPFVQIVRQLAEAGAPAGVAMPDPSEHQQAAVLPRQFRDLFRTLGTQRPQVLFIDDFHWADNASVQILNALVADRSLPLLVLLTARSGEKLDALGCDVRTIDLAPLTGAERERAAELLLQDADPFRRARLCEQAGGNPLYLEEICHAERLRPGSADATPGSTAWLKVAIEARVAMLPAAVGRLVRAAAVVGRSAPLALLAPLLPRPDGERLELLLAGNAFVDIDRSGRALVFRHGITRDVVYACIGLDERIDLHRRIVAALEDGVLGPPETQAAELAFHCEHAELYEPAARHAERAGDQATALAALDRARQHYLVALHSIAMLPSSDDGGRRRATLVQRLGWTCVFDPHADHLAWLDDEEARSVDAGDRRALAAVHYWRAYVHYALGDARRAVVLANRAAETARQTGNARLGVQVALLAAQARASACRYDAALVGYRALDQVLQGMPPSPPTAFAAATRAAIVGDRGDFADANRQMQDAFAAVAHQDHELEGSILALHCAVALWQGRWPSALAIAAQAQRIAERTRSVYVMAMARALEGYAQWRTDRDPDAIRQIERATQWLDHRNQRLFTSLNHGWLATIHQEVGDRARLQAHVHAALRRGRQGDWLGGAMALRALARQRHAEGADAAARHALVRANRIATLRQSRHEHACNLLARAQCLGSDGRADGPEHVGALAARATHAFDELEMGAHAAWARTLATPG